MADLSINIIQGAKVAEDMGGDLVLYGTFESAPAFTAATNTATRWIDGTAGGNTVLATQYGWAIPTSSITSAATASFDTTNSHSGANSLKLDLTDATGTISASTIRQNAPTPSSLFELFPLRPSTSYTLIGWIKTTNVATNGAFIDVREYNAGAGLLVTNSTSKLSGTNGWTQVTKTFTTNASTIGGGVFVRNNVAGNISTAWFDDITLIPNAISPSVQPEIGSLVTAGIQDISGPKIWS